MTRIPRGPYSTATARVRPSTAALAVAYGVAPGTRALRLVGGDVDDRPGRAGGEEAADGGRAADDSRGEGQPDEAEHLRRRGAVERGVAEHRRVVDPARERRGGLGEIGRALGDGGVGGVARDNPRPAARRVAAVEVDRDDGVALGEQAVDDGAADPAPASRDDVGAHRLNDARSHASIHILDRAYR